MTRGFSAVGLLRPKSTANIGGAMRAAHVYGAAMVAVQGSRAGARSHADTTCAYRHMPILHVERLLDAAPIAASIVAVDLVAGAIPLPKFFHPASAYYLFGPEDGTLPESVVAQCDFRVMVPTRFCMNLAATVNVVLYDRLAKRGEGCREVAV